MNERPKVLITGASSGVGLGLANHLKDKYEVIVAARRFDRLQKHFENDPHVQVYKVDLSNENELKAFINRLNADHGYIPYLINNAGINQAGALSDLSWDILLHSMNVNAYAPVMLMKELLKAMVERNFGRIINITSGAPLNCFPGYSAYSASKAYLNAATVTVARELAGKNIKINLMSPGPVQTEMAPNATLPVDICFPTVDYLMNLKEDGVSGKFFWLGYEVPLFPDLEGVNWLEGNANGKLRRVLDYE